jgi:hypothetical protein
MDGRDVRSQRESHYLLFAAKNDGNTEYAVPRIHQTRLKGSAAGFSASRSTSPIQYRPWIGPKYRCADLQGHRGERLVSMVRVNRQISDRIAASQCGSDVSSM